MNTYKKIFLSLIVYISFASFSHAQRTSEFQGSKVINNEVYQTKYNFYISRGDTILNGKFEADKPIEMKSNSSVFKFANVEGFFKQNKVDGEWKFRNGELKPIGGGIFKDYNHTFKVEGNENVVTGNFKEGKKAGPWKIYNWNIYQSEVSDTLYVAELNFQNDKLRGDLKISSGKERLLGSVGDNEMASGSWKFYTQHNFFQRTVHQEWIFENSQLKEVKSYNGRDERTYTIAQDSYIKSEPIDIDFSKEYFKIVNLIIDINNSREAEEFPAPIIRDSIILAVIDKFSVFDSIVEDLSGKILSPTIKTSISVFPYDKEEVEAIENTRRNIVLIDSLINEVNNNPQISLVKVAVPNVEKFTRILRTMRTQLINPIEELFELYDRDMLKYLDRNAAVNKIVNFKLELQLDPEARLINNQPNYIFKNRMVNNQPRALNRMKNLTEVIIEEIEIVKDSIGNYMLQVEQDEKFVQLETSLIGRYEQLKHLTDSLLNEEVDELAGFQVDVALITFLDRKITEYLQETDRVAKSQSGEVLYKCMEDLESLVNTLRLVPNNHQTTYDAYTRQVFNPYTFTNMEENVKPAIWNAYNEILLPSIFNNLRRLECLNVSEANRNFETLYTGMINLLKENTRKAERRVKRTADPIRAAEYLNINLIFN